MNGFYIQIANGLIKDGHRQRMGSAVWEFMWLLDHITQIDENGTGHILGGKPIKLADIRKDLGTVEDRISENLTMLEKEGYIEKTRTPYGLVIRVAKAKKRFGQNTKSNLVQTPNLNRENTKSNKDKTIEHDNKTITNVIEKPKYGNENINQLGEYFLKAFRIPKEDCTQAQSRQYWNLLLRESKTGLDGVKWLIDLAKDDDFYGNNISSSKDLYYKRIKLIQRKRGGKPQIAVMQ